MQRYPHGNLDVLARQLARCTTPIKLIVTDAVFSMDGDLADLPALLALAERYDAWLVVDDAHGFGVLGAQGRGTLSHFGLCSERFIYDGHARQGGRRRRRLRRRPSDRDRVADPGGAHLHLHDRGAAGHRSCGAARACDSSRRRRRRSGARSCRR